MRYSLDDIVLFIHHSNLIEDIEHDTVDIYDVLTAWESASNEEEKRYIEQQVPAEIIDHYKAILFALDASDKKLPKILDIHLTHEILMGRLLNPGEAGFPRRIQVYIGYHVPPAPGAELVIATDKFDKWIDNNLNKDINKKDLDISTCDQLYNTIYEAHCRFEELHPYVDGNGRSGRIFWLALLHRFGFDYTHIHIENRYTYYGSLEDFRHVDSMDHIWKPPQKPVLSAKRGTKSGRKFMNLLKK